MGQPCSSHTQRGSAFQSKPYLVRSTRFLASFVLASLFLALVFPRHCEQLLGGRSDYFTRGSYYPLSPEQAEEILSSYFAPPVRLETRSADFLLDSADLRNGNDSRRVLCIDQGSESHCLIYDSYNSRMVRVDREGRLLPAGPLVSYLGVNGFAIVPFVFAAGGLALLIARSKPSSFWNVVAAAAVFVVSSLVASIWLG